MRCCRQVFNRRRVLAHWHVDSPDTPGENLVHDSIFALKACGVAKELESGARIHENAGESGLLGSIYLANSLIDMYAKCGSLADACSVFSRMCSHTLVSWNVLLLGFVANGEHERALELFWELVNDPNACSPDARTFLAAILANAGLGEMQVDGRLLKVQCLQTGEAIHSLARKLGFDSDVFVASSLIEMYTKCGSLSDAHDVFTTLSRKDDPVPWNVLISGYVANNEPEKALQLFETMLENGEVCSPTARTFVAALMACSSLAEKENQQVALTKGMKVHSIIKQSLSSCWKPDVFVCNTLVDMYSKCGRILHAREVFHKMPKHDLVSWNVLMLGFVSNDESCEALSLLQKLLDRGFQPDARTIIAASKACATLAMKEEWSRLEGKLVRVQSLETGRGIHRLASKVGFDADEFVCSSLIDMFSKCGCMADAREIFNKVPRGISSWNALILGYAENGGGELALELFSSLKRGEKTSSSVNSRTFVAALVACGSLASEELGKQVDGKKLVKMISLEKGMGVHREALEFGVEGDVFVASSLVSMYVKCGSLLDARRVFDQMIHRDLAGWNALIVGYMENDEPGLALELLERMEDEGLIPDSRTLVAAFMACSIIAEGEESKQVDDKPVKLMSLEKAMALHSRALRSGCFGDSYAANTLMDLYSTCGSLVDARSVFDRMRSRTLVSWNSLILGYVNNGESRAGLEIFSWMILHSGIQPDDRSFVAALKACSSIAALETGRRIHKEACRRGYENDPFVGNSLVDFYGKCGCLIEAMRVFEWVSFRDGVTWSSIISGLSQSGEVDRVFEMFHRMKSEGLRPNGVTYVAVLSACARAGLVEEGKKVFEKMCGEMRAEKEHYHCLVEVLGKGKRLGEVIEVVERMPHEADAMTWGILLAACHRWGDLRVGKFAFEALVRADDRQAPAYVTMANLYKSKF